MREEHSSNRLAKYNKHQQFVDRCERFRKWPKELIKEEMFEAYLFLGAGDVISDLNNDEVRGINKFLDFVHVQLAANYPNHSE